MLHHQHNDHTAADGHKIHSQLWQPGGQVAGIVQVLHGLGEYSDRYTRFAAAATQRGFAVCAHDHRGHGPHCDDLGHFADSDGWNKVESDIDVVNKYLHEQFPAKPIVLLGHSMGSYFAQSYAMQHGNSLSAMILSASTWPSRAQLLPARLLARFEAWRVGIRGYSALLNQVGFGGFNKAFEPARTEMDWLSRDENEVDRYVADRLCGGPYTCGLWRDLIDGLLHISADASLIRVPGELPILITGGELDPVGGDKAMTQLAMHYAQTDHQRIEVKIYAQGRHEMLNEINQDEVTSDWLNWIGATTGTAHSR